MNEDILKKKEKALNFLNEILSCLDPGGVYTAEAVSGETGITAEIKGDDLTIFTEKNGRVLEALRILTSSVINDKESDFVRFNIDAGGFRHMKDERIREYAISVAEKVKAEGVSIALPDMNSYDRRIAHMTLQEDPMIRTESEGVEPHRHLVVYPAD